MRSSSFTKNFTIKARIKEIIYMLEDYFERYQAFLQRLVQARLDSGLSIADVAKRLGQDQLYVEQCENGTHRVDITEAVKFGFIYNKELEYFVEMK